MDQKGGLQLLPGTKKRLGIKIPGENRFLYIGSAIFGAVIVAIFALGRQETSLRAEIKQIDEQIAVLEKKRDKNSEAELLLTKNRLLLTSELIKNHRYWTQAFSWLESLLQKDIHVKSMSVATDGKLNFAGTATNYTVISRQIAAFLTDNRVKNIGIGKMTTLADGIVEFGMNLELDISKIILKQ